MARLTSAKRNSLPAKSFAEPAKRAYPIPNRSHAINALARVAEFGSPKEKVAVRSKVAAKYPGNGKRGK